MSVEVRTDSRGRVSLGKLGPGTHSQIYKARRDESGVIYLEPAKLVLINEKEE